MSKARKETLKVWFENVQTGIDAFEGYNWGEEVSELKCLRLCWASCHALD